MICLDCFDHRWVAHLAYPVRHATGAWTRLSADAYGGVVEATDRVGFGPQSYPPGTEGAVDGGDDLLPVEVSGEFVAGGLSAQFVPGSGADSALSLADRVACAIAVPVEVDVVLQGVGAQDVVVRLVYDPEDQPSRLVGLAGQGGEVH